MPGDEHQLLEPPPPLLQSPQQWLGVAQRDFLIRKVRAWGELQVLAEACSSGLTDLIWATGADLKITAHLKAVRMLSQGSGPGNGEAKTSFLSPSVFRAPLISSDMQAALT